MNFSNPNYQQVIYLQDNQVYKPDQTFDNTEATQIVLVVNAKPHPILALWKNIHKIFIEALVFGCSLALSLKLLAKAFPHKYSAIKLRETLIEGVIFCASFDCIGKAFCCMTLPLR